MKKVFSENIAVQLIFLSLVVFLSRLPFLSAGFGAEEDAWLLPITAKNIALSGHYELSRAPGHPLQEIIYSWMWNAGPFAYNLLTSITSVIAVLFFALSLRRLGFNHYLFASFAFAFTPVVFISSTYTIDYMFAMAFVMGSFYFIITPSLLSPPKAERATRAFPLLRGGLGWGAVFLGIAIGFRITSGAMLIPFCILVGRDFKSRPAKVFIFSITTVIIGLLTYIPVIQTYGFSFFTFSDQFSYPNLAKVFYKATVGVFGVIGVVAIIFFAIKMIVQRQSSISFEKWKKRRLPAVCISVLIIYLISYLRLPQKPAYFIPVIPFLILMFGYFLSARDFKIFCVLLTMSSFLFSMNLTDSIRGSSYSPCSVKFKMAEQEIFIDPLTGPVFSDYTKRLNKIYFTEEVFQKTKIEKKKIALICGWWYNELQVRNWNSEPNSNVTPLFYMDKTEIEKYISAGYKIYYLPEQNFYNDQFSQMTYTDSVAKPYM